MKVAASGTGMGLVTGPWLSDAGNEVFSVIFDWRNTFITEDVKSPGLEYFFIGCHG